MKVLHLLRSAPEWQVDFAFFTRASRFSLAGSIWTFERSIVVRNSGLFSQLALVVKAPARTRQRLVRTVWPQLVDRISGAGFEMFSDFAETTEYALFDRPLASPAEASPEWSLINALRLTANRTLGRLPKRAPRSTSELADKPGVAHGLFAALSSNRTLMRHLSVMRIKRSTRARIGRRLWNGSLAVMGDSSWLQTTVAFSPVRREEPPSPETLDLTARIAVPLLHRGYDEFDPGQFCLCPIGPKRIENEFEYLCTLRLADLLVPGLAPPEGEGLRCRDRAYYDILGPERAGVPCQRAGCARSAIEHSVMCRVHHFEMIRGRTCPFED